jgi:hypothetical protein
LIQRPESSNYSYGSLGVVSSLEVKGKDIGLLLVFDFLLILISPIIVERVRRRLLLSVIHEVDVLKTIRTRRVVEEGLLGILFLDGLEGFDFMGLEGEIVLKVRLAREVALVALRCTVD